MNENLCLFVLLCEIAHMNEYVLSTECLVLCQIHTFCVGNLFEVVMVKMSPDVGAGLARQVGAGLSRHTYFIYRVTQKKVDPKKYQ